MIGAKWTFWDLKTININGDPAVEIRIAIDVPKHNVEANDLALKVKEFIESLST